MAMVDVDCSCQFSADSQPKSIGLVLAATRRSVYIHQMNRVNSGDDFGYNDRTIKIVLVIIITVIDKMKYTTNVGLLQDKFTTASTTSCTTNPQQIEIAEFRGAQTCRKFAGSAPVYRRTRGAATASLTGEVVRCAVRWAPRGRSDLLATQVDDRCDVFI